jgi:hypothetical protein
MSGFKKEYLGQTFQKFTILEDGGYSVFGKRNISFVVCLCSCGTKKRIRLQNLLKGRLQSCGCARSEINRAKTGSKNPNYKHGLTKTPGFLNWSNLRNRCLNPDNPDYPEYGGRGLTVCQEWQDSFANFLRDMGPQPARGMSIERKNNDKGYEPGNCVWATPKEQAQNRRNPKYKIKWITNGSINKRIRIEYEIPPGWRKGITLTMNKSA